MRIAVANNEHASPCTLAMLAFDKNPDVREPVASHHNTPKEAMAHLGADPSDDVRYCLAENRSTPAEFLARLGRDRTACVRNATARNKNTPPATLKLLVRDADEHVRARANENPNTPETFTASVTASIASLLARIADGSISAEAVAQAGDSLLSCAAYADKTTAKLAEKEAAAASKI